MLQLEFPSHDFIGPKPDSSLTFSPGQAHLAHSFPPPLPRSTLTMTSALMRLALRYNT